MNIRIRFANTRERDEFLLRHFPRAICMQVPGAYRVKDWGCYTVFLETVTLFPYKRTQKKAGV